MSAERAVPGARAGVVVALLAGGFLTAGCNGADAPVVHNNSDLRLLAAFSAREMCSCVFVMGQTEDFCLRFTRQSPNIRSVRVDRAGQSVQAQAVLFWGARAHYLGRRRGCVLDEF